MKQIFILMIVFVSNVVVGNAQEMQTYKNNDKGFSIKYPSTWEYNASERTEFILIRPLEKQDQVFRENVNLIISDSQNLNLKEFTGVTKSQLKGQIRGYKELSTDYLELGGKKVARIIFQHNTYDLPLQAAYYIYLHNGKSYKITCTSTRKNFDEYKPIFQKIISSFNVEGE